MNETTIGVLYACLCALLWGLLAIFLQFSLSFMDVISTVWFRFFFAFLMLIIWTFFKRPSHFSIFIRPPKELLLAGTFLALNYFFYFKGLEFTSPTNAQILIQLGPILFTLYGIYIFKEKVSFLSLIGFLIASIGFVLFFNDQLAQFIVTATKYKKGGLFIFFGALTWSFYAFLQKPLTKKYPPQQLNLVIYAIGALVFFPMVNWGKFSHLGVGEWTLMMFLGLNTLVAYGAIAEAFKRIPTGQVSIIISMNPIVTVFVVEFLTYQKVSWIKPESATLFGYIGAALVMAGAIMIIKFQAKQQLS